MTTLADTFLADLEDLNDNEEDAEDEQHAGNGGKSDDEEDDDEEDEMEVDGEEGEQETDEEDEEEEDVAFQEVLKNAPVSSIAKLAYSKRLKKHVQIVEEHLANPRTEALVGPIEEDAEYQLIVESNQLTMDIDNEIALIHKYIRDRYAAKFPELDSLVMNPLDYARVVRQIANEMDMTLVDLSGLLPSATIMVVSVTGSTTTGQPLPDDILDYVLEACDQVLALDAARLKIVEYVESRMTFIAPNLSAIVGSTVAAKMIAAAGGLTALSKIPMCNIQVLGAKKKALAGFSTATLLPHAGFIYYSDLCQNTPPSLRKKAQRLIAGRCTLAARIDSFHESPDGAKGRHFREEIEKRVEKLQEPPPAKQPKPLTAPDDKPRKKRGGKRVRKLKERFAMTELRKTANRMAFGVSEETYQHSGKGFGMLGALGSGKLRIRPSDNKALLKVAKKHKGGSGLGTRSYGMSGTTSGLSSSLAFTPVQGLELENPNAAHVRDTAAAKYFSSNAGFLHVGKKS